MEFHVKPENGESHVYFKGDIDEKIGEVLQEVRPQIVPPKAYFHLDYVDLINSIGISTWLTQLKDFKDIQLVFVGCSNTVINTCRIVPNFLNGPVVSFYARYFCDHCGYDEEQYGLITAMETHASGELKKIPCSSCQRPMEVDDHDQELVSLFTK